MKYIPLIIFLFLFGCGDSVNEAKNSLESLLIETQKKYPEMNLKKFKELLTKLKASIDKSDYDSMSKISKELDPFIFKDGTFSNVMDVIKLKFTKGPKEAISKLDKLIEEAENETIKKVYQELKVIIPKIKREDIVIGVMLFSAIYFEQSMGHAGTVPAALLAKITALALGVDIDLTESEKLKERF